MGKLVKKAIAVLIIAFVVFYLYTKPEAAADFLKFVFGIFDSVGRFFTRLVR